ncbi:MAG: thioredoxin domain-containing protein [Sulfuricella sp.]
MKHNDSLIIDVNLHDFEQHVIEASKTLPVLVDFWADWCSPCLALSPVLDRVVKAYAGKFTLAKVEVDEGDNMKLAGRYGLRGFPTVLMFINGEEVGRFSSAKPEHWVREFIEQHCTAC